MTLRTTAVIAGAIGLLMLIAGLIAQGARPDDAVVTESTLDTPVVVLGPEVLALPEIQRIAVTVEGGVEAHTARPVDAEAWLVRNSSTYITGYATWDELTTRTASRIVPDTRPRPRRRLRPRQRPRRSADAEPIPESGSDERHDRWRRGARLWLRRRVAQQLGGRRAACRWRSRPCRLASTLW